MTSHLKIGMTALGIACLLNATAAIAAETKLQKKDLPAAVQHALDAEVQGSTVKGFAKETEGGKTFYEVETIKNGHARDVLFDPEGHVVEVEEELAMDAVPAAVKQALATHGKLVRVESVTKGQTVTYEGHFAKGSKPAEMKVTADGKPVAR
jgi:hypothetical protein